VIVLEERGKWPHIRTNWVTASKGVLQVTSRSSQPWIENNAALIRGVAAPRADSPPLLTYAWKPITLSDIDEGPRLENYLVAVADAAAFGADLMLPLHERFQKSLILGKPDARADWNEIRRYLDFYSWNLPARYHVMANIGVVTADPLRSFEVMNLLLRHNLPFERIDPAELRTRNLSPFDLLILLDEPSAAEVQRASELARAGRTVLLVGAGGNGPAASERPWRRETAAVKTAQRVTYPFGQGRVIEMLTGLSDPNAFALDMRQVLGADRRIIDIWNGITVLTAPYREPDGQGVLVTVVNYAAQPLPVQLRVRGTFSAVHYESPEEPATLLPYEHRNGYTEFALPAVRVGGRVFLSRVP
jgi:hypothetical protein